MGWAKRLAANEPARFSAATSPDRKSRETSNLPHASGGNNGDRPAAAVKSGPRTRIAGGCFGSRTLWLGELPARRIGGLPDYKKNHGTTASAPAAAR